MEKSQIIVEGVNNLLSEKINTKINKNQHRYLRSR